MASLKGMTEEEKRLRKRKQLNEAQRRYYQKHKEYYKNYGKNFYKNKYEDLKEKIDKIVEICEPLAEWGECTINGKILKQILNIVQNGKDGGE